jgi:hypothetical protein
MEWLSPFWLIVLVPWAAVALWLFQGRRPPVEIPYLRLWHGPVPLRHPKRKLHTIPLAVAMALLATLFAVLAGARPAIRGIRSSDAAPLVVVVDRGISMSAQTGGHTRYEEAARAMVRAIDPHEALRPVELVPVPGEEPVRTTVADCAERVASLAPTARDTRRSIEEVVNAHLLQSGGPVLVVTDQPVPRDGRIIQIPPDAPVGDVGIVTLAARAQPTPQVMVRVRNQSSLTTCALELSTDAETIQRSIDLPPRGGTRDYFFNPSRVGSLISARIMPQDDLPADDQAWLVREGSSPRVEIRTPVPEELQRVIGAYQQSRPAMDGSTRLLVVGSAADLPADALAVIIAHPDLETPAGVPEVIPHPVTAHIDWQHLSAPIRMAGEPPAGWTPIVKLGGRPAVAVSPEPARRQVWVGFDAPNWPITADFVVFWTSVFDWAGGAGRVWVARPLDEWTPEWKPTESASGASGFWPGVYRRSDGAPRAFNAPDVMFLPPPRTDWRSQVAHLESALTRFDLSRPLLVLAAVAMLLSAATWKPAARLAQVAEIPAPAGRGRPA